MLNKNIIDNPDRIREQLKQPVIIIENALDEDFAENLCTQLLDSKLWEMQSTDIDLNPEFRKGYSYKRNHIDATSPVAPPLLKDLNTYLNSTRIRDIFTEICGTRCDLFRGEATIFNKGDHINRHNDRRIYKYDDANKPNYVRTLTFNYYLTKNWDPDWGGNLVWDEPQKIITPAFNSLVLFNVTRNSYHQVVMLVNQK